MRKFIIAVAGAAALLVPLAASAGAQASVRSNHPDSSVGCQGVPANLITHAGCGSQVFAIAPFNLAWGVTGKVKSGAPVVVVGYQNGGSPNGDWYMADVSGGYGTGGPNKRFEYAPNGDLSGLCISDISDAQYQKLVLRSCNNSGWQDFSPSSSYTPFMPGYLGAAVAWQNVNSNYYIQDPSSGLFGTQLSVRSLQYTVNQGVGYGT